jgi:hypothetical protein
MRDGLRAVRFFGVRRTKKDARRVHESDARQ